MLAGPCMSDVGGSWRLETGSDVNRAAQQVSGKLECNQFFPFSQCPSLLWNSKCDFVNVITSEMEGFKMRLFWTQMDLKSNGSYPSKKRRKRHAETQARWDVEMEEESRTKKCQKIAARAKTQEERKAWILSSSRTSEHQVLQTPWFGHLVSSILENASLVF